MYITAGKDHPQLSLRELASNRRNVARSIPRATWRSSSMIRSASANHGVHRARGKNESRVTHPAAIVCEDLREWCDLFSLETAPDEQVGYRPVFIDDQKNTTVPIIPQPQS
jgi:hypothetical protein